MQRHRKCVQKIKFCTYTEQQKKRPAYKFISKIETEISENIFLMKYEHYNL